ncbi:MAG: hypothetical protein HQL54_04495 [Magnetococcales bacterium]|nr:hypothetical protein [Magnetococcales bacterium]
MKRFVLVGLSVTMLMVWSSVQAAGMGRTEISNAIARHLCSSDRVQGIWMHPDGLRTFLSASSLRGKYSYQGKDGGSINAVFTKKKGHMGLCKLEMLGTIRGDVRRCFWVGTRIDRVFKYEAEPWHCGFPRRRQRNAAGFYDR